MKIYIRKETEILNSMRGEVILQNKNAFELFSLLKDPEKRLKWDKNAKSFEVIK